MGTTEEECELQYSDGEDAVEDVEEEDGWDDKPHRITMDGLYLGSMDAANNLEVLQQKGITHILMVSQKYAYHILYVWICVLYEKAFSYVHANVYNLL